MFPEQNIRTGIRKKMTVCLIAEVSNSIWLVNCIPYPADTSMSQIWPIGCMFDTLLKGPLNYQSRLCIWIEPFIPGCVALVSHWMVLIMVLYNFAAIWCNMVWGYFVSEQCCSCNQVLDDLLVLWPVPSFFFKVITWGESQWQSALIIINNLARTVYFAMLESVVW